MTTAEPMIRSSGRHQNLMAAIFDVTVSCLRLLMSVLGGKRLRVVNPLRFTPEIYETRVAAPGGGEGV